MGNSFIAATARLLMEQRGWASVPIAAQLARALHVDGDEGGAATWCGIVDAILEIGRTFHGPMDENVDPSVRASELPASRGIRAASGTLITMTDASPDEHDRSLKIPPASLATWAGPQSPGLVMGRGFLDPDSRQDLIALARDGSAAHRLARRANALVLLDDGMSCDAIAAVLLLDNDMIRSWYRHYKTDDNRRDNNRTDYNRRSGEFRGRRSRVPLA